MNSLTCLSALELNKTEILLHVQYLCDAVVKCLSSQLPTYHLGIKASGDFLRNVLKAERKTAIFGRASNLVFIHLPQMDCIWYTAHNKIKAASLRRNRWGWWVRMQSCPGNQNRWLHFFTHAVRWGKDKYDLITLLTEESVQAPHHVIWSCSIFSTSSRLRLDASSLSSAESHCCCLWRTSVSGDSWKWGQLVAQLSSSRLVFGLLITHLSCCVRQITSTEMLRFENLVI